MTNDPEHATPKTPHSTRISRPTIDTPFHIDFDWWERNQHELRVYLRSHLCDVHRASYEGEASEQIDTIDPYTAEVTSVDGVLFRLRSHCSQQPDYITPKTSIVDAVFRVFLMNGNQPLSPRQLADKIGKDAGLIFKTIGGRTVYKGLRPVRNGEQRVHRTWNNE